MPIAPDCLIHPAGRIHPDLFPDRNEDDLVADVQEWVNEAYGKAEVSVLSESDQDQAAAVWAYYRAFDAAAIAMAANPNAATMNDAGTSSYAKDQRDTIREMARQALAEFMEIAPRNDGGIRYTGGSTVSHGFAW